VLQKLAIDLAVIKLGEKDELDFTNTSDYPNPLPKPSPIAL
jgi:hypothetical protein